MRTQNEWLTALCKIGVRATTALVWAPIFADVITDSTFSKGEAELDDFVREVCHESNMLESLEENLNYSVEALLSKFGRHRISEADARRLGRIPGVQRADTVGIANAIYGGPWGLKNLGNKLPGDGWRNRGGGLMQITGAFNLMAIQKATGIPVYDHPELLRKPSREALLVVIHWWEGNVPDDVMGKLSVVRREVNGGQNGLEHTTQLDTKVQDALGQKG